MTREFANYRSQQPNTKPGMFRSWATALRFVGGSLMAALVLLAAGVGIWNWGGRVFSLALAAPIPIQMFSVSVLFALVCLTLGYRRFSAYRPWSHWAWGVLFFIGTAVQNFLTMGGGS